MAEARGTVYDDVMQADVMQADVLLGRGKSIHSHPGNIEYRNVVKEKSLEYQAVEDGAEKDAVARAVIDSVAEKGGKFLRPTRDGDRWVECPASIVRTKVKQALRDMMKDRKPMSQKPSAPNRQRSVNSRQESSRLPLGGTAEHERRIFAALAPVATDRSHSTAATGMAGLPFPQPLSAQIVPVDNTHAPGSNAIPPSLWLAAQQPSPLLGPAAIGNTPNLLQQRLWLGDPNLSASLPVAPVLNQDFPLNQIASTQQYLLLLQQAQMLQQPNLPLLQAQNVLQPNIPLLQQAPILPQPNPNLQMPPPAGSDPSIEELLRRIRDGQR